MDKERRPIIAGNWKMNKTVDQALALVRGLHRDLGRFDEADIVVCPPFTALAAVSRELLHSNIRLGAQNMNELPGGARTGEISAGMLKEFLVRHVILGHSERRQFHGETSALVAVRTQAALQAGLLPIVCLGETLEEREAGRTAEVVERQLLESLEGLTPEQAGDAVLAYEPVWAIGTGRTATAAQAQEVHALLRARIAAVHGPEVARRVRIQYGGSVKPGNARELMSQPDVDGALVGGASLDVRSFTEIVVRSV